MGFDAGRVLMRGPMLVPGLLLALAAAVGMRPASAQELAQAPPAQPLKVELLLTEQELALPPAMAPVQQRAFAGEGGFARIRLPRRQAGYWLRLTRTTPLERDSGQVLVLHGAHTLGAVEFHPPAAPPVTVESGIHGDSVLLRRGWHLPLPNGWPPATVAYLHVDGKSGQAVRIGFADVDRLVLRERADARLAAAAVTTLVLVAIFMLGLWIALRDLLYLSFAGYLFCVAVYSLLLSGDAGEMAPLRWMTQDTVFARQAFGTLAAILQLIFTARFLELGRLMPRANRVVAVMVWLMFGLLAVLLIWHSRVEGWYTPLVYTVTLLMMPVALAVAIRAWRRGAAYAGHFLLGWTPLLVMLVLMACHHLGLADVPWIERVLPLGAVLQSGVLALALSQHAAHRHRVALLARQSSERDTLTGALNRPALERLLAAWSQMGHLGAADYAVLLVDLDNFKEINLRHGYPVGDTVMQHVYTRLRGLVRPDDTVARMESDLFAVVSECGREDGELLAQRIVDGFQQRPFTVDGQDIMVSASIGMAMSRRGEEVGALLQRAEEALAGVRIAGHGSIGVSAGPRGSGLRRRVEAGPGER